MSSKIKPKLFTTLSLLVSLSFNLPMITVAAPPAPQEKVYVFEINQGIFPPAWRMVKRALDESEKQHCNYVVVKLNTYGGQLDIADSIRVRLLHAKPVVLVWIQNNAASAGALIAISCDSIYMRRDAKIGAASVVNESGEVMPDKYQSYMRGIMRSTAEQTGRDPRIAEGMVTPNNYLKDIADTGRIITLTAHEAEKYGYCDGIAESTEEVLKQAHVASYSIIEYDTTWLDYFISFLLNPFVNGILLMLILGGIYFEFQHPGAGFPILAAITAALLYFGPLYLDGLAEHWEILIFVVGVIFLAVEIFVVPTIGALAGIGIVCIVSGLTLALVRNENFDFSLTNTHDVLLALVRVLLPLATAFFLFLAFGRNIFKSRMLKGFVLTQTQESTSSYHESHSSHRLNSFIHKTGIAITTLRPSGQIEIDNERFDAMADSGLIERGEQVTVIEVSGNILVVRKAKTIS
ncbi:MAG: nodulation protein NfeD [Chitinophagales bacterium]|nr:nodulation protein NfeD [Chitinophagales bacterium]